MLNNITWEQYLAALAIAVIMYYLVIGRRYLLPQIRQVLSGWQTGAPTAGKQFGDAELNELEDVTRDLRYGIFERTAQPVDKDQVLQLLKGRLAGYKGLDRPAFRTAINNYIIYHGHDICGLLFTKEELNRIWDSRSSE
ncbi:MAG: hypothetical protein JSU01_04355 [Bacteroidetes bacterium]|nr:hypothetical protein [Bacteroidota bacterium]